MKGNTTSLDLSGIVCPTNFVRAKLKLETMSEGEILELIVDGGEPLHNVPRALQMDGHHILEICPDRSRYKVTVQKA